MRKCHECGWSVERTTREVCRVRVLSMAGRSESVMKESPGCLSLQRMSYVEFAVQEAREAAEIQFDKSGIVHVDDNGN